MFFVAKKRQRWMRPMDHAAQEGLLPQFAALALVGSSTRALTPCHLLSRCPATVSAQTVASGARQTIQILEALRSICPDAQFILRGLGPRTSDPDTAWPNVYIVVGGLCLASPPMYPEGRLSMPQLLALQLREPALISPCSER